MDPTKWGPHLWDFLHTISFNYPNNPSINDMNNNLTFLKSLENVIPCDLCKNHYKKSLKQSPPKLDSKISFIKWVIDLHNEVNKRNGKPVYSYNKAIELIKHNFESDYKCNKNNINNINKNINKNIINNINKNNINKNNRKYILFYIIGLLLIIIILYIFLFKNKNLKKVIRYN